MKTSNGLANLMIEIPAAFTAVSSELSPKLPKVMMAANNIPRGKAIGTNVVESSPINLLIVRISNPLPINSSIQTHINCMMKINQVTKNAPIKGGIKDLMINLCNAFNQENLCKNRLLNLEYH